MVGEVKQKKKNNKAQSQTEKKNKYFAFVLQFLNSIL